MGNFLPPSYFVRSPAANWTPNTLEDRVDEANLWADSARDYRGNHLLFELVDTGADVRLFWRLKARIRCNKVTAEGGVYDTRILRLNHFVHLYTLLRDESEGLFSSGSLRNRSVSVIVSRATSVEEDLCGICYDSEATTILHCSHAFCPECVQAWQEQSLTCPLCRRDMGTTADQWELVEAPSCADVNDDLLR